MIDLTQGFWQFCGKCMERISWWSVGQSGLDLQVRRITRCQCLCDLFISGHLGFVSMCPVCDIVMEIEVSIRVAIEAEH